MTVVTIKPGTISVNDPVDGMVGVNVANGTFANMRDAAGNISNYTDTTTVLSFTISLDGGGNPAGTGSLYRLIMAFDTSSIPDEAIIENVDFMFWPGSKSKSTYIIDQHAAISIVGATPASQNSLSNSDYGNLGTTRYASDLLYSSVINNNWNALTFNATGIAAINKTGLTKIGLRLACDVDNVAPQGPAPGGSAVIAYSSIQTRNAGTSFCPKLVITYSIPTPPTAPTLLTVTCIAGIGETILPDAPLAAFTADVTSGLAPLTVQFTDYSTNTPTSWLWEFGDGATSTSQSPSHIFAVAGPPYLVRLTATNAQGSSAYQMTIIATTTPVVTPPGGGTVTPGGSIPGATISSLLGKIAYYVVDTNNNQIEIRGQVGELLKTFGGIGNTAGKFFMPTTCSVINGRQRLDRAVISEE